MIERCIPERSENWVLMRKALWPDETLEWLGPMLFFRCAGNSEAESAGPPKNQLIWDSV